MVRRRAAGLLLVLAAAGCGGSKQEQAVPANAYLTAVHVDGSRVMTIEASFPGSSRVK